MRSQVELFNKPIRASRNPCSLEAGQACAPTYEEADMGSYFYPTKSAASFTGNKTPSKMCFSKFKFNILSRWLHNTFETLNWVLKF